MTNLNLNLTLAYTGTSSQKLMQTITHFQQQGLSTLFYWWEPHPLLAISKRESKRDKNALKNLYTMKQAVATTILASVATSSRQADVYQGI